MIERKTKPVTLAEVVTVGDFIKHLESTYNTAAPVPPMALKMLAVYLPMLNLPKK